MKQLISRRSFLKAAGVTAAAASMAIGAPAASACWFGDKSDVTILYTNDVHTYIDKQSPKQAKIILLAQIIFTFRFILTHIVPFLHKFHTKKTSPCPVAEQRRGLF